MYLEEVGILINSGIRVVYLFVKKLHVISVLLTISGFALRGYWMLTGSALLNRRLTKVLPPVVDTVLLLSGLIMVVTSGLSPLANPWLAVKLSAVIMYILLGSVALERGRTGNIRAAAFILALLMVFYIVTVALTRNPTAFL